MVGFFVELGGGGGLRLVALLGRGVRSDFTCSRCYIATMFRFYWGVSAMAVNHGICETKHPV